MPPRAAVRLVRVKCLQLNSLNCVSIGKKALSAREMSAVLKLVFSLLKTKLLEVMREIQAETQEKWR